MPESDAYYVNRCRDGHAEDFRFLVRRYQQALLVHLRWRLRDLQETEEAAQEVLVRAFLNLAKLRNPDSFFPWLLGIANHVTSELTRRQTKERGHTGSLPPNQTHVVQPKNIPGGDGDLESAVSNLEEPLKQVILLRFYAENTCSEIADQLGVPIGTVTKRLSRAYAEIRRRLGD